MKNVLKTDKKDASLLIARLILGAVMLGHGLQKMFGWYEGYGFTGTANFFSEVIGLPYFMGVLIILFEVVGSMALLLGIAGRVMAAASGLIMLGAIISVHGKYGFFMNYAGNHAGEGYELHLLAIGLSIIILIKGSGMFSLDAKLTE